MQYIKRNSTAGEMAAARGRFIRFIPGPSSHAFRYHHRSIFETCAIAVTQKVIGGKWAFVLLHFISKGTACFSELRKRMPSVSQATLTKQLRILEEASLIHREVYPQVPPKVECSHTVLGKSFIPVLHALVQVRWIDPIVDPALYEKYVSGQDFAPVNEPGGVWFEHNNFMYLTLEDRNIGQNHGRAEDEVDIKALGWNAPFMEDNAMTWQQVSDFVTSELQHLGIGSVQFDWSHPSKLTTLRLRRGNASAGVFDGDAVTEQGHCYFTVSQVFHGIPVLQDVKEGFRDPYKVSGRSWNLSVGGYMMSENAYSLFADIAKEDQVIAQDVPLCSFEQIKAGVAEWIQQGHVREILGLEFGYAVFHDEPSAEAETATLFPVWIASCAFEDNTKNDIDDSWQNDVSQLQDSQYHQLIYINAQTGEALNPFSEDQAREMSPAVIPW